MGACCLVDCARRLHFAGTFHLSTPTESKQQLCAQVLGCIIFNLTWDGYPEARYD